LRETEDEEGVKNGSPQSFLSTLLLLPLLMVVVFAGAVVVVVGEAEHVKSS